MSRGIAIASHPGRGPYPGGTLRVSASHQFEDDVVRAGRFAEVVHGDDVTAIPLHRGSVLPEESGQRLGSDETSRGSSFTATRR